VGVNESFGQIDSLLWIVNKYGKDYNIMEYVGQSGRYRKDI